MATLQQLPELTLTISDLSYWVPHGKKGQRSILKDISGCFRAGQLTAIVGPSGSGKTTFMNIAAGYRTRRVSGTFLINGHPRSMAGFRRHSCYITQAAHLLPFLTVYEAMMAAALLKLGPRTKTDRDEIIADILQRLRLTDCRNTRTRHLSGGEAKRLSIALELVNNPPIMFFDEPTSGLDSRNSHQCVQLLQDLARGGRTIICTVHQASARIFQMFDQLYALSEGQCIFRGTTHELLPFLDSMGLQCPPYHNPADFLVEVAAGEYGDVTSRLAAEISTKQFVGSVRDKSLNIVPHEPSLHEQVEDTAKSRMCKFFSKSTSKSNQVEDSGTSSTKCNDGSREETLKNTWVASGTCKIKGILEQNDDPSFCASEEAPISSFPATLEINDSCSRAVNCDGDMDCISSTDTKITIRQSLKQSLLTVPNDQILSGSSAFPSSMWLQFRVLLNRTFLTVFRDTMLTKLRLGTHIVVALIVGLLYYGVGEEASTVMDNTGCLFFVVFFILFSAMMPTLLTFPLEMNVLVREHLNRWYALKSYYLAKAMADLPFQIFFPLLSVLIVYYMTAQPFEMWRFCLFTFFSIMTSLVAQSIGLTIGAAFTVQEAVFLGPASVAPMLLFSGFFIQFSTIPIYMRWITYLSFVRYGFEGAVLSIYGFGRSSLKCSKAFCYLKAPTKIMETLDVDESSIYLDGVMLLVYFLAVRVLGFYILRWKVRNTH